MGQATKMDRHSGIMNASAYEGLRYRFEAVTPAHANTFQWVFENSTAYDKP